MATVRFEPIGVIGSPFTEEVGTPVQPATAGAAQNGSTWGPGPGNENGDELVKEFAAGSKWLGSRGLATKRAGGSRRAQVVDLAAVPEIGGFPDCLV